MAEKNGEGHVAGQVQRQQEECWQLADEWPVPLNLEVILQAQSGIFWAAFYSCLKSVIYCV